MREHPLDVRGPTVVKRGRAHLTILLGAVAALPLASCELLKMIPATPGSFTPPTITFQDATLVQAPSQRMMEAYYCPQVVPDPFGVRGGAATLCRTVLGPAPAVAEMQVAFELRFKVTNPNNMPIPLAELLTGVNVFPGQTNQDLGAVCLKLCGEGQPGCTGAPDASSCRGSSSDIRSLDDFARATAGLLVSQGLALASGQSPTFTAPRVSSASELDVRVRFAFGPEALLGVARQVAVQSANELKAGRSVTFRIPYRLEGTVWFDAGSFGRVAVGFGPSPGEWVIPTDRLRVL